MTEGLARQHQNLRRRAERSVCSDDLPPARRAAGRRDDVEPPAARWRPYATLAADDAVVPSERPISRSRVPSEALSRVDTGKAVKLEMRFLR